MPRKTFVAGDVLQASEVNTFLMNQSVMTFASESARNTAITLPVDGMVTYLEDTKRYQTYNGTAWVTINQINSFSDVPGVSLSTPTAGQKLVFDGTNWVNLTGYVYVETVYFTSSGTFTKASYPWLRAIRVRVQAGGASGAGATATGSNNTSAGAGGGAGGYAELFFTDIAALDASVTVTRGAGGGGVLGTAGNNGEASEFGGSGDAWRTRAGGGFTGIIRPADTIPRTVVGGAGGDGSHGDFFISGGGGGAGLSSGNIDNFAIGGTGGAAPFSGGGRGAGTTSGSGGFDGGAGGNFGGGGGGAMNHNNQSSRRGGNGGNGIVIVELYA
jgi:hypothetical protein